MQNSRNFSLQRQSQKHVPECSQIPVFLRCSNQCNQYLPGMGSLSHQQMPQIPLMCQPVEEGRLLRGKIVQRPLKNPPVVLIHNPAVPHRYNIIKTPPLMHSQCQGAVLYLVPEGKFHLVPVAQLSRACFYRLPNPWLLLPAKHAVQKLLYLLFLQRQLLFIRKRQICTAAAASEMGAGRFHLIGRLLQHLQHTSLSFSFAYLCYHHGKLLSGKHIFYRAVLSRRSHFCCGSSHCRRFRRKGFRRGHSRSRSFLPVF